MKIGYRPLAKAGLTVQRSAFRAFLLIAVCASAAGVAAPDEDPPSDDRPLAGEVRLVLPGVVYGVVGIEMNVYFDNVVLVMNPDDYAFRVTCGNGRQGIQQSDRWTFVPQDGDIGDVPFELEVRDEDTKIGVVLIPPPAASQDAFGASCGCVYNRLLLAQGRPVRTKGRGIVG